MKEQISLMNSLQVENWLTMNNMYSKAMNDKLSAFKKYFIKGEQHHGNQQRNEIAYIAIFMITSCLSSANWRQLESEVVTYTIEKQFLIETN